MDCTRAVEVMEAFLTKQDVSNMELGAFASHQCEGERCRAGELMDQVRAGRFVGTEQPREDVPTYSQIITLSQRAGMQLSGCRMKLGGCMAQITFDVRDAVLVYVNDYPSVMCGSCYSKMILDDPSLIHLKSIDGRLIPKD